MSNPEDVPVSRPLDAWLGALSEAHGAPGGGAASGVMLGIAASLMGMVAAYSPDSPSASGSVEPLSLRRAEALRAVEADGVVSARLGAALALPSDDPDRDERVRDAALEAADSVVELGAVGIGLLPEARLLATAGNLHLAVDLAVAVEALGAGLSGASLNLRANLNVARSHGASRPRIAGLEAAVAGLSDVRQQVAQVAEELSSNLA